MVRSAFFVASQAVVVYLVLEGSRISTDHMSYEWKVQGVVGAVADVFAWETSSSWQLEHVSNV